MCEDQRKADLLQHAVRHGVVGLRLADDPLQIESLVEVERRQAKETRTIALTSQICAPHMQMHAAEFARHDILERRMSNGFTVDTPCEHEASKPINRRQFIIGKFVGIQTAVLVLVLPVVVAFWFLIVYKVLYDAREGSLETTAAMARVEAFRILQPALLEALEQFDQVFSVLEDDDAVQMQRIYEWAKAGGREKDISPELEGLVRSAALTDAQIEAKIEQMREARKARDFVASDQIRAELLAQGILIEQTKEGIRWRRK